MEWKKLSEKIVYNNYRKVKAIDYKMPDSSVGTFEVLVSNDCVCALVLTKDKKVILQKQFRPGPECYIIDLVGGYIDEGETPLNAIKREALEEIGYSGKIIPITTHYVGAYFTHKNHVFLIKDAVKVQETKYEKEEFIEIVEMSLKEFKKHVKTGNVYELGGCYAILDYLGELK